jgi:hypothetical protein
MHTLLDFSTSAAIESVVDEYVTPRLAAALAAAAPVAPNAAAAPGFVSPGSSYRRRHKRSNTYPDTHQLGAADLAVPYPAVGLHVKVPEAPTEPSAAAAASLYGSASSKRLLSSNDGGTGLSTPDSTTSYPGGASSSRGLPKSIFLDAQSGVVQAGTRSQGLWHTNPAFRASWDLEEQPQQLLGLRRSNSAEGASRSPFETSQEGSGLQLKDKDRLVRSMSSSSGSPLIATSYHGGAPHRAESDGEAGSTVAASTAAAATAAAPAAMQPGAQAAGGASGVPLQQSGRASSSGGGTLAQRRAVNIAPLAQASAATAAAVGRGNRFETWRSTLSPVPSASHDHAFGSGLVSAASAAPTFGRRSSAGVELGLTTTSSVPGAYAPTPASRISGFGSQLFSISGRRLHVPIGTSASSSAAGSDEEGSSSDSEEDMQGGASPTKLQTTRLQGSSFRHISGASMRQIARSMRRMGGECNNREPCSWSVQFIWIVLISYLP